MSKAQMEKSIERTRKLMQEAAKKLEFIEAAQYRNELLKLEDLMKENGDKRLININKSITNPHFC